MTKISRIALTFLASLLFLTQCDSDRSCSANKTEEILKTTNQFLSNALRLENDFFSSTLLTIQPNGTLSIKHKKIPHELARQFVAYRAAMHKTQKGKQKYLSRWENKDPSTAAVLEASIKLAHKGKEKPCAFVTVTFEEGAQGKKIISLI